MPLKRFQLNRYRAQECGLNTEPAKRIHGVSLKNAADLGNERRKDLKIAVPHGQQLYGAGQRHVVRFQDVVHKENKGRVA